MARIKIELPEKQIFETEIAVRVTDLNYGGHVGNDTFLSYLHEARLQCLLQAGYKSELHFGDTTVGIIMADAALQYLAEGFYGDSLLIKIFLGEISRVGYDLYYQIIERKSQKEVLRAKTGILSFDYALRKVAPIPEELKNRWQMA
ncbi:acyl-CoA thioesterase [Hugenholtzia roseola]|uniref:acyl-CoA thioesterase n=1 Tax=Hugenholtzia roseola TaxID=1002 RepID=UPI000479B982|nr:thioesterase family protein [Hugenholtzia roseola]